MGTFGRFGILSFNGNKIITTSGGGALVCESEDEANQAKFLASQARDEAPHYKHTQIGYNYRMSNVLAGIGRGQMEVLPTRVKQRRDNFSFYYELLSSVPGISLLKEPSSDYYSNFWLSTILVDPQRTKGISREDIRLALEQENIESRPLWKPMHLQPVFSGAMVFQNNTSEKLFERGLCLPSGSSLTPGDRQRISIAFNKIFKYT